MAETSTIIERASERREKWIDWHPKVYKASMFENPCLLTFAWKRELKKWVSPSFECACEEPVSSDGHWGPSRSRQRMPTMLIKTLYKYVACNVSRTTSVWVLGSGTYSIQKLSRLSLSIDALYPKQESLILSVQDGKHNRHDNVMIERRKENTWGMDQRRMCAHGMP